MTAAHHRRLRTKRPLDRPERERRLDKKANVHKDKLLQKGFRFDHMTNILNTKGGKIYHFCYDYGYLLSDNDWIMIVKRLEGKDKS